MTKNQIKMLTTKQLEKLSTKWLMIIASKHKQFGKASDRAFETLRARGINFVR
jgi:hypothetical protein